MTIKVNGVRIAARAGSWGMDDMPEARVAGALEPYSGFTAART